MRLRKGHKYTCKAVKIVKYGAVMEMEDGSTELLHISNIADVFVKDVHNFIKVGETYVVTAIPGEIRPMEITLRDVDIEPEEEENLDNMSFEDLLNMYPPTYEDIKYKRDRFNSKKRR